MFDYIKIDEGANRLLMCILILAICWFLVKWKKRATLPFNVVMVYIYPWDLFQPLSFTACHKTIGIILIAKILI